IMFVLDITGSMQTSIDGVGRGIGSFVDELKKSNLDARLGLTVFPDTDVRFPNDCVAGIFGDPWTFTWRGRHAYPADVEEFRTQVLLRRADGGGVLPESSLEAMMRGADKPVRPDAVKVQILIPDASYIMPGRFAGGGETRRAQPDLASTKRYLLDKKVR